MRSLAATARPVGASAYATIQALFQASVLGRDHDPSVRVFREHGPLEGVLLDARRAGSTGGVDHPAIRVMSRTAL